MTLALCVTAAGTLALFFWPTPLLALAAPLGAAP